MQFYLGYRSEYLVDFCPDDAGGKFPDTLTSAGTNKICHSLGQHGVIREH